MAQDKFKFTPEQGEVLLQALDLYEKSLKRSLSTERSPGVRKIRTEQMTFLVGLVHFVRSCCDGETVSG